MTTRRALWGVVAAIVLLLGLAGLVVLANLFVGKHIDGAGDWADVLSLLLAYLAAMVTLLVWIGRQVRSSASVMVDESLVVRLRRAVRVQWSMEVGTRQVQQPRPLRLRLRPTRRPVAVAASAAPSAPDGSGRRCTAALDGPLVLDDDDSRPSARALVDAFRADPRRQLVILGEPGAGKSTLAMLFTLAALDAAELNDAVPVLLSVAGWDPAERVERWVARRVQQDYPDSTGRGVAGQAAVARLIEDHLILPVLDGLDEMPDQLREAAIGELDRAAGGGLRMVLTCRSAEFEQAVTQAGALSRAAVVDIEPVGIGAAEMFLIQREVAGSSRWVPVLESMRRNPGGPVASVLSLPLMIVLARRAYQQPTTEPQRLAEFATVETIERRRWSWGRRLAGVGMAVSLLPVTAGFIVPNPLRASLHGSTGWILSVAFNTDGTLASVSSDNTVRLWDPATGNPRRTLTADSNIEDIGTLAVSPDGLTLAAAGQDAVIWLWDPVTGQLRHTLTSGTSWVPRLAFSPDGSILAGAGHDGVVRLWDPATGQLRRTFTSGPDWLVSLAFSPNGSTLVGIDQDGVARLWNPATGQLRRTFTTDGGIDSLAFSPDGSTLASAGDDGVIRLWNVAMLGRRQPR